MPTFTRNQLIDILRRLGAADPETSAAYEIDHGEPILHRTLILKALWEAVISEDNEAWIDQAIAAYERRPNNPGSGSGRALTRMLAAGVSRADITDLIRAKQFDTLFDVCYRLDGPVGGAALPELDGVAWTLVTADEGGHSSRPIHALHESILSADPTGREMRPRADGQDA